MKMVLMSACGVSTLFEMGNAQAAEYWLSRFIQKGYIPTIKIIEMDEAA